MEKETKKKLSIALLKALREELIIQKNEKRFREEKTQNNNKTKI
jgi:hypothetical protein